MFYRVKDTLKRSRFDLQVRRVLDTPAARLSAGSPAALATLLQQKDLRMFLLAAKSFMRRAPISRVYVINDGTLTSDGKAVLKDHIPGVTIMEMPAFRNAACPSGGCWERLLGIAELVKEHYVIQLDSDTLSVGSIEEVGHNIRSAAAFTLGTLDHQEIESMSAHEAAARKKAVGPDSHVQLVAESNFSRLQDFARLRYVRGCAGFTGFPKQSFSVDFVKEISAQMERAIGPKWREWGSEQVMSNIVVSNIAGAKVLPHPKYSSSERLLPGRQEFIHFIGYCRFDGGVYAQLGNQIIDSLLGAEHGHIDANVPAKEGGYPGRRF